MPEPKPSRESWMRRLAMWAYGHVKQIAAATVSAALAGTIAYVTWGRIGVVVAYLFRPVTVRATIIPAWVILVGLLAALGVLALITTLVGWLWAPRRSEYVADDFEGIHWGWAWEDLPELGDLLDRVVWLRPYCPQCGLRLEPEREDYAGGPGREMTTYSCVPGECDYRVELPDLGYSLLRRIAKRVERSITNGSWKAAVRRSRSRLGRLGFDLAERLGCVSRD